MTRRGARAWAWAAGLICHASFAVAVALMIVTMAGAMHGGHGRLAAPFGLIADLALVAQFPLAHSWLLTPRGVAFLRALAPPRLGSAMSTTTYATIASWQTIALFGLWTPLGPVWWRAQGLILGLSGTLYAAAWGFLLKAILDAGISLQIGSLGWRAVARGVAPIYPPLPRRGLFRLCRQPIYLGFALTLWTPPAWSPDQLVLALTLGFYCVAGPRLKEARFAARHGGAFEAYRAQTPYFLPRFK